MAEPTSSFMEKLVGWCFAALLAAMALYGAVSVVQSVWRPLCIGLAVVGAVVLTAWLILRWRRF